jgi:hypothetical protein
MCRDFAAWTAGAAVPNWVDGRGTWRITSTSQGPALGQIETTDNGGPYRFVTWDGSRRFADCTASSATVLSDQASENCVLSRVQDASNFYALCLKEASHRRQMGPPQYEWVLERVVSDSETRLAGGNLDIAPGTSHSLILNARGASLTALLDRVAQPVVIDTTYSNGAVGLATDGAGGFSTFCLATN